MIDTNAVLGLWRPDVVKALKSMNAGVMRFGGSTVEEFEWTDTIGNWDTRVPFPDDPWGGLQENFVGVEEFVQLVQQVDAEPLICLRWTGRTRKTRRIKSNTSAAVCRPNGASCGRRMATANRTT